MDDGGEPSRGACRIVRLLASGGVCETATVHYRKILRRLRVRVPASRGMQGLLSSDAEKPREVHMQGD